MRLLDRYLFRELLMPLAYCLIGIQSFVIFSTVFTDAGKIEAAKLHFFETIEYATVSSLGYLTIVLPVSLLLALLMALTQHSRYNEITAMRAAGVSLWRICIPYFLVGLIASGALFALNELVVPWSGDQVNRLLYRYAQTGKISKDITNLGFVNMRRQRTWVIPDYHVSTKEMINPDVNWSLPDGSIRHLSADRAIWTNGVWTFYNVEEDSRADVPALPVPLFRTNVLAIPEFDETPQQIAGEVKMNGYLSLGNNLNMSLHDIIAYLKWHPDMSRADKSQLLTELNDRIATPFTCLVVALIAIPFGAAPGRRNLFFGVAGSIFIFFAYYVLQRVSLAFGSSGAIPAWLAAWLPNFVFATLGLILTIRIR